MLLANSVSVINFYFYIFTGDFQYLYIKNNNYFSTNFYITTLRVVRPVDCLALGVTVSFSPSDLVKSWGGNVMVTCRATRQGWLFGPQYKLLLTWPRAFLIATCHVRDVVQKAGMPGIKSGAG